MKFIYKNGSYRAIAENARDIEVLVALKGGQSVSLEGTKEVVAKVETPVTSRPHRTRNRRAFSFKKWTDAERQRVVTLVNEGTNYKLVAKTMGRTESSIHQLISRMRKDGQFELMSHKTVHQFGSESRNIPVQQG